MVMVRTTLSLQTVYIYTDFSWHRMREEYYRIQHFTPLHTYTRYIDLQSEAKIGIRYFLPLILSLPISLLNVGIWMDTKLHHRTLNMDWRDSVYGTRCIFNTSLRVFYAMRWLLIFIEKTNSNTFFVFHSMSSPYTFLLCLFLYVWMIPKKRLHHNISVHSILK